MFRHRLFLGALALFALLSTPAAHAQTSNLSAALTRMDAIIAEMEQLRAEFAALSARVGTGQGSGAVLGAQTSHIGFTESLEYGATNDDIEYIQKLLATDPEIYPYGVASGFFGPKTVEGIKNLQARFGLDPVGVVGPATRTILEAFLAKYPDANFPSNVLAQVPQVTPKPVTGGGTATPAAPAAPAATNLKAIAVDLSGKEGQVRVLYTSGKVERFTIDAETEEEAIVAVAKKLGVAAASIEGVTEVDGEREARRRASSDADEGDAEDALDDAEDALDDAEDALDEAEVDGEDVDYAWDLFSEAEDHLRDAEDAFDDEDWEEAVDLAEEAADLARDAEDAIGESRRDDGVMVDDIEEIRVSVEDGEANVTVYYEDGDKERFTVEEDDEDDILEELADELDVDADELEDLIEWDFGDVDEIIVTIENGEADVRVEYEGGKRVKFTIDEDDEDDMLEEIADEVDEDADDLKAITEFDYLD